MEVKKEAKQKESNGAHVGGEEGGEAKGIERRTLEVKKEAK